MYKTIFHIKDMDCPSEEQMIRMKLGEFTSIKELSFDYAFVYGLSLYAITGTSQIKRRVAIASGYIQLSLACLGLLEVFRRFFKVEEIPDFKFMIFISFLALLANTASLIILNKSKSKEVHIVSSQIFTSNDIIANSGVILAGILVLIFNTNLPDLIVGIFVFYFVVKGAIRILQISKNYNQQR